MRKILYVVDALLCIAVLVSGIVLMESDNVRTITYDVVLLRLQPRGMDGGSFIPSRNITGYDTMDVALIQQVQYTAMDKHLNDMMGDTVTIHIRYPRIRLTDVKSLDAIIDSIRFEEVYKEIDGTIASIAAAIKNYMDLHADANIEFCQLVADNYSSVATSNPAKKASMYALYIFAALLVVYGLYIREMLLRSLVLSIARRHSGYLSVPLIRSVMPVSHRVAGNLLESMHKYTQIERHTDEDGRINVTYKVPGLLMGRDRE